MVLDADLVDLVGDEPSSSELAGEPDRAEVVVAHDVRHDVADAPLGAQGGGVPLLGGESRQEVGHVGAFVLGEADRVGVGHGFAFSAAVAISE